MDTHFDVAIVGFGPTGALLANFLGQAGLRVLVLEKDPIIHPLPRAVHFDGEVMRIFQSAGVADPVAGIARASTHGMHFVNADGETLMIRRGTDGPGPHGWAGNWYFHQPELDAVLREAAENCPGVTVVLEQEVRCVRDRGVRVEIQATHGTDGGQSHYSAAYVVGCDGARSMVREAIGSGTEDLGLHQPWLVVAVLARAQSARAASIAPYTVQHCDPKRPRTRVHVKENRHRWEIMLLPQDEAGRMTKPETFWPLVADTIGPEDADIERAVIYTFHSLIARRWRRGRLLIAGDSAHQTPPFLGQGMCAGLRDVANLWWKLALVLKGEAQPPLLDTYQSEREPHVQTFIKLAVELGALIQATDPAAVRARDEDIRQNSPTLFDFPQPRLGPGVWFDDAPETASIFFQPKLDDGRWLDTAAGNRFALLLHPELAASPAVEPRERKADRQLTIVDHPGAEVSAWLEQRGALAVLIRPDRYVQGLASSADELQDLMDKLASQLCVHA